jgi:ribosome-associated heat shock protein Hsp15
MSERNHGDAVGGNATRRVDQWLWFARVVKSRTMAAELVTQGRVRINRERVEKPSQVVKPGDVVTVTAHSRVRILKVAAMGVRRGPPAEAATLFEDLTPPREPRDKTFTPAAAAAREPGSGRPTKRDRRDMDKFERGGENE